VLAQTEFDFLPRASREKSQQLFFALMPDEAGVYALTEFTDRFLFANGVAADRLKPMIVMQRVAEASEAVLFGAKLAGQSVAAAGLALKFDILRSEKRRLMLTSSDETLAALAGSLGAAISRHGLKAAEAPPCVALAQGVPAMAPVRIKPVKFKVTGLALLRGDPAAAFQVVRRWPLNTATNRSLTAK